MIIDKIVWESNGLVKRNPNINRENIIPKSSTSEFPCGKITVRYHNQRSKLVTAYFQGEMKTRTWGNGSNYTYPDGVLRVTLPFSSNKFLTTVFKSHSSSYSFQGELPSNYKLEDMTEALYYIRKEVEEMS